MSKRAGDRERREHERVSVDIEVDYQRNDTFLFAYITDLSEMGIFVQTSEPEPPGTRLNLCFRSHLGRMLSLAGEVIWVNPPRHNDTEGRNPGMGIRFVDLNDDDRDELLKMVRTFAYLDGEQEEEDRVGREILGDLDDTEGASDALSRSDRRPS